jgi:hypothetical protein
MNETPAPPAPACSVRKICKECGQVWIRCVKCGRDLHPDEFAVRYEGTSTGKCMECTFDGKPASTPKPRDTLSLTSYLFTATSKGATP